jgi:hypothetical protein
VSGHSWLDRDAGPVVRPYAMTGGRTHSTTAGFDVVALVTARAGLTAGDVLGLQPEHRAILGFTRDPLAVAEVASQLDLPLGVVRVLLGDLLHQGLISMYEPPQGRRPQDGVLRAVIDGLRAL